MALRVGYGGLCSDAGPRKCCTGCCVRQQPAQQFWAALHSWRSSFGEAFFHKNITFSTKINPQMDPIWPQRNPKWPQHGPKDPPNGPKMAPSWPQRRPRWAPKGPKRAPKSLPNRSPKAFQHRSRKRETPDQSETLIWAHFGVLLGPMLGPCWAP